MEGPTRSSTDPIGVPTAPFYVDPVGIAIPSNVQHGDCVMFEVFWVLIATGDIEPVLAAYREILET